MSNRDTQFAGFARLLLKEIDDAIGKEADRAERGEFTQTRQEFADMLGAIIARRAGDFAAHVAAFLPEREMRMMRLGILSPRQVVDHVPDMTEPLPAEIR